MAEPVPAKKLASQKYNKKAYEKKKLLKGLAIKCKVKGCMWRAMPSSRTCLKH